MKIPTDHGLSANGDARRGLAILPAYNEAQTVASVVGALRRHQPDFDVLVVDDGSTDSTAARARATGATVVRHPFNLGIGGAVQTGYLYALEHGYELAIQVDADGQHEPACIDVLLRAMASDPSIDMVCGSRFIGKSTYRVPAARRTGIRLFARLLSIIIRRRVTDPTSGFRLANRRAIRLFASDYPHDYPEVEAVLMCHFNKLKLVEAPVKMSERGGGKSSITLTAGAYYMTKVLLALLIGLVRARPTTPALTDPETTV